MARSCYLNPPFAIGELVSAQEWDAVTQPRSRIGSPARVVEVSAGRSETGWIITIEGPRGVQETLDANWLRPWSTSTQLDWTESHEP